MNRPLSESGPVQEFNVGDMVWSLLAIAKQTEVTCPDCLRSKYVTVILGDGSQETIDCSRCERGYQGSFGYLIDESPDWQVVQVRVTRKEQKDGGIVEYGCEHTYYAQHVYATEEEAVKARDQVIATRKAEYLAQLQSKERSKASWAWNVRYHRQEIRDLAKRIEYHQAKLDVAKLKSKEKI